MDEKRLTIGSHPIKGRMDAPRKGGGRVVIEGRRDVTEPRPARARSGRVAERSAVTDFRAEADRLGVPLGAAPTDEEACARLRVAAEDATDIFATADLALNHLTTRALDGRGRNGVQILRDRGLPGVLAGLDNKRFGSRG